MHIYLYALVPFFLLLTSNCLLIQIIYDSGKNLSKVQKNNLNMKRNTSLSIIFLTFMFVIMVLPASIAGGYFLEELFAITYFNFIYLMDKLLFTYHGLNFLLFSLANKRLFSHIKSLLSRKAVRNFHDEFNGSIN